MPQNKSPERMIPVTFRMPERLYVDIRVLLCDPRTGKPRHGTFGASLNRVLREWADQQKVAAG